MNSHLVTIKVSIESGGDQWMQLNGAAFNQNRFKSLDTQTVKGWGTVQQNRAFFDDFFKYFPNFRAVAFNKPAGTFYIGCIVV